MPENTLLSTEVVTVRQRVSTGWKKPHVKYAAKKMKQRPHFEAVLSGGKQKKNSLVDRISALFARAGYKMLTKPKTKNNNSKKKKTTKKKPLQRG